MKRVYAPLFLVALALAALCGHPARAQKGSTTAAYRTTGIGPFGNGWSRPLAVNDQGQAVGKSYSTSNDGRAFLYDLGNPAAGVQILPLLAGRPELTKAQADGINR